MNWPGTRRQWTLVRIALYLVVVIVLFARAEQHPGHLLRQLFTDAEPTTRELHVAGDGFAPGFFDLIFAWYQSDQPKVEIHRGGGTNNQALETLLNGQCEIAFLTRPVDSKESQMALDARGDSVLCRPIALAAIEVLRTEDSQSSSVTTDQLRLLALGERVAGVSALYVTDPNDGLWAVFCGILDISSDPLPSPTLVFVANQDSLTAALARDPRGVGLRSGLCDTGPRTSLRTVAITGAHGDDVLPTRQAVADGAYPLFHYCYVAYMKAGPIEARKLVTHLCSPRGQRQVERTAALPATLSPRSIVLTRKALGGAR